MASSSPDVRLTNAVASLVHAVVVLALLVAVTQWAVRLPIFALRDIRVEGEMERSNPTQVRNVVVPRLSGNFFTLDLQAARETFEELPWVRQAVLQRVFPNRLDVRLQEYRVAAIWSSGDAGAERLVSTQGEIFEANVGDVEDEGLPIFEGSEDSAGRILEMHGRLAPVFTSVGGIQRLKLSPRGTWSVDLGLGQGGKSGRGAHLELGRGTDVEIIARSDRFVRTMPQVTANYSRPLQYADLRHKDGYVVKLQGITTTQSLPTGKTVN